MYRESSLTVAKQNIPLAVHLMSLAASLGHVRAMTNLAHAFFDVESWLGHYAREQLQIFRESNDIHDNITEVEASITGDTIQDVQSNDSEHSDDDLMTRWGYNSSSGMQVILTATSEVIRLPEPLRPDCSIALPLLKYMAEHTFRPNDLAKNGLKLFMAGDIWGALELYEEAADLGVTIAQENVAFLYQLISEKYCPKSRKGNSFQLSTRWHTKSWKFLSQFKKNYTRWMNDLTSTFPFLKFWSSTEQKNQTRSDSEHRMKFRGYDKILNSPSCSDYFHDMALIRWIQVAKSGDVEALRKLAHQYQETDSITQSVLNFQSSKNRLRKNNTKAALLYAIAASEHGDISSIISLGWFIQQGIAGNNMPFITRIYSLL